MHKTNAEIATAQVAIIGAGTAGCLIANLLNKDGVKCLLLEKSRGVGGRCSRRRIHTDDSTNYAIDLGGSDFFPAQATNRLKKMLNYWISEGYLSKWVRRVSRFDKRSDASETVTSLCGTPSMNTWHSMVTGNINLLTQSRVANLKRIDDYWHLFDDNNQAIVVAKKLVITAPPEQTRDLLNTLGALTSVHLPDTLPHESLPQYVCAISFDTPLHMDADVYQIGHALLHSAVLEDSKPGRAPPTPMQQVWVLHSTYEWAQQQNHVDSHTAAVELAQAFCQHFSIDIKPTILTSHYWRMAKYNPTPNDKDSYFWDEQLNMGCCGDWLGGGGTVGALNSAVALHEVMIR